VSASDQKPLNKAHPEQKHPEQKHPEQENLERIGAALLAVGRPLSLEELGRLLVLDLETAAFLVTEFEKQLERSGLGFALERIAGGFRLIVRPDLVAKLTPLLTPPALSSLSQAALEVLAVIAYKQPISRGEIELMRGASASALVTLQERELVKVVGRKDSVGRPLLYGTTAKFLLEFGLQALSDLPPLEGDAFSEFLRG
jgi:segregation and condensation protein B